MPARTVHRIRDVCFIAALTGWGGESTGVPYRISELPNPKEVVAKVILQMGVMAGKMTLSLKPTLFERIVFPGSHPPGSVSITETSNKQTPLPL